MVTANLRVVHHHSLELLPDAEEWIQAHIALAEKWEGQLGTARGPVSWRERALRAEAEASAYRLRMGYAELQRTTRRAQALDRNGAARAGG